MPQPPTHPPIHSTSLCWLQLRNRLADPLCTGRNVGVDTRKGGEVVVREVLILRNELAQATAPCKLSILDFKVVSYFSRFNVEQLEDLMPEEMLQKVTEHLQAHDAALDMA